MEKKYILTIGYKSIILGALTKLPSIDTIDFHLIKDEFTNETGIKLYGEWYNFEEYKEYIEFNPNGIITLKEGLTLASIVSEEYTVFDKLLDGVDPRVKLFFDKFDIDEYKKRKKDFLQKETVLNNANVLLISDNVEDYEGLLKSGFKNIDYFKSIIRADAYFESHPSELHKYHLVLIGNQNVQHCCFYGNVDIEKKLSDLSRVTLVVPVFINRTEQNRKSVIKSFLSDRENHRSWEACEETIEEFYNRVIENMLINKVLTRLGKINFVPYVEYINRRTFIPRNKEDLRILYLDAGNVSSYATLVASKLGLNITFIEDNNFSLGLHVKNHLGDYDIIIASNNYSKNILRMNAESTEQCKDTGRGLTLLMTYEEKSFSENSLGDTLKIAYSYGGVYAPHSEVKSKEIGVLKKKVKGTLEPNNESVIKGYSNMMAIIESAVGLYNEALNKRRIAKVKGTRFRTAEEINEEYLYVLTVSEEQRRKEFEPIIAFDKIRNEILNFLYYKSSRLTRFKPKDIKIIDVKNGVRVENIIDGRVTCALTFKREYKEDGLRIFTLEVPTKRGTLSSPELLGLYIGVYDGRKNTPNRPSPIQANALSSIEKKVAYTIKPINDEVERRNTEQVRKNIRKLIPQKNQ